MAQPLVEDGRVRLAVLMCLTTCLILGACSHERAAEEHDLEVSPYTPPALLSQAPSKAVGTSVLTGRVVVDDVRHCLAFEPADEEGAYYALVVPRGSWVGMAKDVIGLVDGTKLPIGDTVAVTGEVLDFASGDDTPDDWFKCADGTYRFVAVAGGA